MRSNSSFTGCLLEMGCEVRRGGEIERGVMW